MKLVIMYLTSLIYSMSLSIFPQTWLSPIMYKKYGIHMEIVHFLMVTILFTKTNTSMVAAHMYLNKANINRQYTIYNF